MIFPRASTVNRYSWPLEGPEGRPYLPMVSYDEVPVIGGHAKVRGTHVMQNCVRVCVFRFGVGGGPHAYLPQADLVLKVI